jgi:predicted transposase YbfD/YdcC
MSSSFISHFSSIEDPRQSNKQHQLMDILFLSICAVLCGAEGWEDIEDFGHVKIDWLKQYLPFEKGIPRHDTIARVLCRIEPASIQTSFINWVKDIAQQCDADVIAIDGKCARRSFTTKDRKHALHMVSAWSCANGLVLGQRKVDGKSNEITAIPALLDIMDIEGCTLTLDAMGCQQAIVEQITAKGGNYVVSLKGNQGNLNEDVKAWFQKAWREHYSGIVHEQFEHTDSGHGRIEVRKCLQVEIDTGWLNDIDKWRSIKTVIQIDSQRHINGKVTNETRYYISSLPVDAERLNRIIRQHWEVESMHWTLDMTFKEDASRIRRGNAAEVMNALRKVALNIVKNDKTRKASMKRKLKMAALDDDFRAQLLLGV